MAPRDGRVVASSYHTRLPRLPVIPYLSLETLGINGGETGKDFTVLVEDI